MSYRSDLAHVHDTGFGDFAAKASPWLIQTLRERGIADGLVVDLGCGSGIWAAEAVKAGYHVLGIDFSADMLALAHERAPAAEFRQASVYSAALPECVAVTALGEVFNYLFDRRPPQLDRVFRRAHRALRPGGLFLFDVATPGRVPEGSRSGFQSTSDWTCLYRSEEDHERRLLTRTITTFRRVGDLYRRDDEVHRLRLLDPSDVTRQLRQVGFRVRHLSGYGTNRFPPGWVGFLACKPK